MKFPAPFSPDDCVAKPCRDADHLNAIMNADGVREFLKLPDGFDDVTPLLDRGLFLANEHGFLMIQAKAPQCYEFHTAILPASRGRAGYALTRAAAEFMFLRTDCVELHTFTPSDNPAAVPPKTFGFQPWFDRPDGTYYRAHIMDWARKAPNLEKWGAWFHESLESAKEAQGATIPAHDEDRANNRYAGLACAMIANGSAAKAVWAYNHWATTAGYHPVTLTSHDPVEFDTGDAVIRFRDNVAEFLSCL